MRSASRVRPHKTPAQGEQILAAYRQSALGSHQFASRHGIAASTLFRWLRESPASKEGDRTGWIEVPNLLGRRPPCCFGKGAEALASVPRRDDDGGR